MESNVNRGEKNLHLDNSYVDQPKGTTRFVLNGVNETSEGDRNFISNEQSNTSVFQLPAGYIPLGKAYMSNNKQVVLSVAEDESASEIGVVDSEDNYVTVVNADLGFKIGYQIDVTYRLRRGCEDTIYFLTPTPMVFNFSKLSDFQDGMMNWDVDKFKLFQRYTDVPTFSNIEVEENGSIKPGSYNASIQYLDSDLNPTEWITTTPTINIYNDSLSRKFSTIRGSTGKISEYQDFGITNKSIKLTLANLDDSYPFYRIAIIASNNGDGQINQIFYSQEISTEVTIFNYTGLDSIATEGTVEEIQQFANIIEEANHLDQVDNMLLLADSKGKQINFCELQKYASRIKADLTTKTIILNAVTDSNPKSPTVHFEGTGYMPGEIYSFAVVWIFDDGDISPAYHIPGRNWDNLQPIETAGYWSLMSYDNKCQDTFYTDNSSCNDFWGKDSEGDDLLGQPVRHHRFPLRSEVSKPLFTEQLAVEPINLNQLSLSITGTIDAGYTASEIEYVVEYEIEGNISFFEGIINTETYDPANGLSITITTSPSVITVNNIYENGVAVATPSATTNLTYATAIGASSLNVDDKLYQSEIFGIKFSGIEAPPRELLGGHEIIGYYIVRNKRTEENKTILDTGVLTPLIEEPYFVAHGHIMPNLPDTTRIKNDAFALIHPEHRFGLKEYKYATEFIKEGEYRLQGSPALSNVVTQDVMAGTSYDPEVAKRREKDYDGFSLHTVTRDNEITYVRTAETLVDNTNLEEIFYLDALNSKVVTDAGANRKEIFNVSGDNKIGIVQLNQTFDTTQVYKKLPYVVMKRDLSNPYGNFRVLEYYKDVPNRTLFQYDGGGNLIAGGEVNVFGGDSYITPMRYHNSLFYDIRLRKRASKKGVFNIILGALAVIAGVLITVGTLGGGTAAGIVLIGFGVSQVATGIQKETIAKVYSELYDAGLRDAVNDDDTDAYFGPNPPDDEIQWITDVLTNVWFETSVNMGLRTGASKSITDFLDAPVVKAKTGETGITTITLFGNVYNIVNSAPTPQNELDSYILEKLTVIDTDNENGKLYQGFSQAELYEVNPDYRRRNYEKIFYALGLEYDCCSECVETFPSRVHYSLQSFQEELSDNYRVFLPNNYKDIEGGKGKITNIYRLYNAIYIHTEEGLWHLPQNYQERVTNDIVSFIGTGSYFETPPRLMVDDQQSSTGTKHKWGCLKTKHGILFPNEQERKWYMFDGKQIKSLSEDGISNWSKQNMKSVMAQQYYLSNTREYPYLNNPSNKYGEGFISTYDTSKERLIVTRKDYALRPEIIAETDYEICVSNGQVQIFYDYQTTIAAYEALGYQYVGIIDCQMQFLKIEYQQAVEQRTITTTVANTADIHVFYDTSGSFGSSGGSCLQSIKDAVANWIINFGTSNPDWTGTVYEYDDATERWLNYAQRIATETYGGITGDKDIVVVSFCNEADSVYHDGSLDNPIGGPTASFTTDYNNFITGVYNGYNSFIGIHYPIVFNSSSQSCPPSGGGGTYEGASKNFLLHSIAALKGVPMTVSETETFSAQNPGFTAGEWTTLKTALQGVNPYPDNGLENYNWVGKWDRYAPASGAIIDDVQFQNDIDELLQAVTTQIEIEVTVQIPVTVGAVVDPVVLPVNGFLGADNSWTMSYSLKDGSWVGWHSYRPNFYMYASERFHSWINGLNDFWRHNIEGSYHTFYGQYYPHIIEFVSVSNPISSRIWDFITFQTEARQWSPTYETYVDKRLVTFNKVLFYNTRQCSGILNVVAKDSDLMDVDYLQNQVVNNYSIIADRTERDWSINDFRDIVTDYNVPMFNKTLAARQSTYYIDKVVNILAIDVDKDWTQLESFKDKFLVVRFIFDNFDNIQLLTNYSIEYEYPSMH